MAEEFGLPGIAALNSPYGLAPARRVSPQHVSLPRMAPAARPQPRPQPVQRPAPFVGRRRPEPGLGVLQPQHLPSQQAQPRQQQQTTEHPFPVIGQDIPLEDFVNLHKSKESSGDYQALNTEKPGNTASGAYQYTDATWNNYGGYAKALLAPKEVQDRRYMEDLQRRLQKYGGDPFKAMAEHYLPALANDTSRWDERFRFRNGNTVAPVSTYLRQMVRGSSLEEPLETYLQSQGIQ